MGKRSVQCSDLKDYVSVCVFVCDCATVCHLLCCTIVGQVVKQPVLFAHLSATHGVESGNCLKWYI